MVQRRAGAGVHFVELEPGVRLQRRRFRAGLFRALGEPGGECQRHLHVRWHRRRVSVRVYAGGGRRGWRGTAGRAAREGDPGGEPLHLAVLQRAGETPRRARAC